MDSESVEISISFQAKIKPLDLKVYDTFCDSTNGGSRDFYSAFCFSSPYSFHQQSTGS
jgi:hypothetical protein